MRVFTTSYLNIHHEPEHCSLELEWRTYTRSEELRIGFRTGIHLAQQHRVRAWIANMTSMQTIWSEDQEWIKVEWLPRLRPLGIEFLAIVISTNALNRQAVHDIMVAGKKDGHVLAETMYFSSAQDAREWVRQCCLLSPRKKH